MVVPDPNGFGGEVRITKPGLEGSSSEWTAIKAEGPYSENSRGAGLADMARAIQTGRPHRANGLLALHIVEIMEAIHRSAVEKKHVVIESRPPRPAPFNDWEKPGFLNS
jgi:predicted dehydrogenase